ncbi:hypothetical protein D3C81_762120 [compost metagenome]
MALGASQVSKSGAGRFIQRLKTAANNDPEVMGGLRSAHFNRLAVGRNGEPLDMGKIINNIKATEYSNASVVKALYDPGEWMEIKRLASALEPMVAKGDMAKSSGSTERLMRALQGMLGGGIKGVPLVGDIIAKPLAAGRNLLQAERAVGGRLAPRYETSPIYPAGFSGATEERVRD